MFYCTSARHHHENESFAYLSTGTSSLEPTNTPLSAGGAAIGMPPMLLPETDYGWNVTEYGVMREMGGEGGIGGYCAFGIQREMAELDAAPAGAVLAADSGVEEAVGSGVCFRSSGSIFLLIRMQKSS
jgi:hypothetical protein